MSTLGMEGESMYPEEAIRASAYSARWARHSDLIRTQMQETGKVRLSFLTLRDLVSAVSDLGIDPNTVEFSDGYAVVRSSRL